MLFNDIVDYLLYWHTLQKRLISGLMNNYKGSLYFQTTAKLGIVSKK